MDVSDYSIDRIFSQLAHLGQFGPMALGSFFFPKDDPS